MSQSGRIQDKPKERGTVLLLALVVLVVLLLLGASLLQQAQNSVYRGAVENRSTQSFHLAEAGINRAVWALAQTNGWQSYDGETDTQVGPGHFNVSVYPVASARPAGGMARVTATGFLPGPGGTQRQARRVQVVIYRNRPWPFGYALAGNSAIDLGNSQVDSYRSTDGPYGGFNVSSNATIAVNATTSASVSVGSNGALRGDILVGMGCADPYAAVNLAGTVSGSIKALDAPLVFDPVTVPAGAIDLGAVSLSGSDTLSLAAGVYRAQSISITGTASLIVTGDVQIYVDGPIVVAGNGIANDQPGRPGNLILYGTANCLSVSLKGSSTFYGCVYAPQAAIVAQGSTQSGEIFGSLVGSNVKLEGLNTRLHYDESLALRGKADVEARSWQAF